MGVVRTQIEAQLLWFIHIILHLRADTDILTILAPWSGLQDLLPALRPHDSTAGLILEPEDVVMQSPCT
jgi:hypothetical protein